MKNYINDYYGKKIPQEDGTIKVELYEKEIVKDTIIADNEGMADAMIVPWVVQEGYTKLDLTSETDPVDTKDSKYETDFLKV